MATDGAPVGYDVCGNGLGMPGTRFPTTTTTTTTKRTKVTRVERFTTVQEIVANWTLPDSLNNKMTEVMCVLNKEGASSDDKLTALHSLSKARDDARSALRRHMEMGRDLQENLNEVYTAPTSWIFTTEPERAFVGDRLVCDCFHGSSSLQATFYKTVGNQLLVLRLSGLWISDRDKTKKKDFKGWIKCETNLSNFSPNEHLSRFTFVDILSLSSPKARAILEKMERQPRVTDDGQIWFMCNSHDNSLVAAQYPESFDSIATSDKKAEEWVQANATDVLDYALTDAALSLSASVALALLWKKSPFECRAIAQDEMEVLEECMKFERKYRADNGETVASMERTIKNPIRLFSHTGDLLYRGDTSVWRHGTCPILLPLVFAPNGKFYPLKREWAPSFVSETAYYALQTPARLISRTEAPAKDIVAPTPNAAGYISLV
jgi:hypothetical protein